MPRIRDEILDCVLYLYASESDAEGGVRMGGSDFLVAVPSELVPDAVWVYAVTNKHVIESGYTCVRLNTIDGQNDVIPFTEMNWLCSKSDDLAVAMFPNLDPKRFQRKWVNTKQFLTKKMAEHYDFGLGEECFVVGRFINHEGCQRNLPSLRFGYLAQMPWEAIRLPYGRSYIEQESYLVDIKSIGGYSGSPVFWHPSDVFVESRPGIRRHQIYLVGIDWGNLCHWSPVCDENGKPLEQGYFKGSQVDINTGMMAVVPAWKLIDLLDEQKELRAQADKEFLQGQGPQTTLKV